jgi:hypothetical protein
MDDSVAPSPSSQPLAAAERILANRDPHNGVTARS